MSEQAPSKHTYNTQAEGMIGAMCACVQLLPLAWQEEALSQICQRARLASCAQICLGTELSQLRAIAR